MTFTEKSYLFVFLFLSLFFLLSPFFLLFLPLHSSPSFPTPHSFSLPLFPVLHLPSPVLSPPLPLSPSLSPFLFRTTPLPHFSLPPLSTSPSSFNLSLLFQPFLHSLLFPPSHKANKLTKATQCLSKSKLVTSKPAIFTMLHVLIIHFVEDVHNITCMITRR